MTHITINAHSIIKQFHDFMKPDSDIRVLRLTGKPKMGKTYLLTKVFPEELRQHHQDYYSTVLDCNIQKIIGILEHIYFDLLSQNLTLPKFSAAYQEWNNAKPVVDISKTTLIGTHVNITANRTDDIWHMAKNLTEKLFIDLNNVRGKKLLILVDAVDNDSDTQKWLMETFLVQLIHIKHLRFVVAGRSLPEASSNYLAYCCDCELKKVEEKEEYISYSKKLGFQIEEKIIEAFAQGSGYTPGIFHDIFKNYSNCLSKSTIGKQ
ncbi:hypothetical protein [Nostoc mirabile]|uniref:hypothetical protein n=1 Tax=Nostoc mirabile TaxID=2907820 RepID=UPI001E4E03DC|nr:hypothetical protein [Nostoc mirabile]